MVGMGPLVTDGVAWYDHFGNGLWDITRAYTCKTEVMIIGEHSGLGALKGAPIVSDNAKW